MNNKPSKNPASNFFSVADCQYIITTTAYGGIRKKITERIDNLNDIEGLEDAENLLRVYKRLDNFLDFFECHARNKVRLADRIKPTIFNPEIHGNLKESMLIVNDGKHSYFPLQIAEVKKERIYEDIEKACNEDFSANKKYYNNSLLALKEILETPKKTHSEQKIWYDSHEIAKPLQPKMFKKLPISNGKISGFDTPELMFSKENAPYHPLNNKAADYPSQQDANEIVSHPKTKLLLTAIDESIKKNAPKGTNIANNNSESFGSPSHYEQRAGQLKSLKLTFDVLQAHAQEKLFINMGGTLQPFNPKQHSHLGEAWLAMEQTFTNKSGETKTAVNDVLELKNFSRLAIKKDVVAAANEFLELEWRLNTFKGLLDSQTRNKER